MTDHRPPIAQPRPEPAKETKVPALRPEPDTAIGFSTLGSFEFTYRVAKMLSSSTMVPEAYRASVPVKKWEPDGEQRENPNAISNCIIALNMANRLGADPLMVMQNLFPIEGRPSWSAQFVIAAINSCGRFSPLRFDLSEAGPERQIEFETTKWENRQKVTRKVTATVQDRTCRAWVIEKASGTRLDGPEVSIHMAEAEGWLAKNGSKWLTMPEVMLRYRASSMFGRLYAPELLMGLPTQDEVIETIDITPTAPSPMAMAAARKWFEGEADEQRPEGPHRDGSGVEGEVAPSETVATDHTEENVSGLTTENLKAVHQQVQQHNQQHKTKGKPAATKSAHPVERGSEPEPDLPPEPPPAEDEHGVEAQQEQHHPDRAPQVVVFNPNGQERARFGTNAKELAMVAAALCAVYDLCGDLDPLNRASSLNERAMDRLPASLAAQVRQHYESKEAALSQQTEAQHQTKPAQQQPAAPVEPAAAGKKKDWDW